MSAPASAEKSSRIVPAFQIVPRDGQTSGTKTLSPLERALHFYRVKHGGKASDVVFLT
jgi:hypothetical protein